MPAALAAGVRSHLPSGAAVAVAVADVKRLQRLQMHGSWHQGCCAVYGLCSHGACAVHEPEHRLRCSFGPHGPSVSRAEHPAERAHPLACACAGCCLVELAQGCLARHRHHLQTAHSCKGGVSQRRHSNLCAMCAQRPYLARVLQQALQAFAIVWHVRLAYIASWVLEAVNPVLQLGYLARVLLWGVHLLHQGCISVWRVGYVAVQVRRRIVNGCSLPAVTPLTRTAACVPS